LEKSKITAELLSGDEEKEYWQKNILSKVPKGRGKRKRNKKIKRRRRRRR